MTRHRRDKIVIDAAGGRPGRLATQIAKILMGKHKASYDPHLDKAGDKVIITNVSQMVLSGKKLEQKEYLHHTMHPGGLKSVSAKKIMKEDPAEALRHAVNKMLPKNKLRTARMLRLKFE